MPLHGPRSGDKAGLRRITAAPALDFPSLASANSRRHAARRARPGISAKLMAAELQERITDLAEALLEVITKPQPPPQKRPAQAASLARLARDLALLAGAAEVLARTGD